MARTVLHVDQVAVFVARIGNFEFFPNHRVPIRWLSDDPVNQVFVRLTIRKRLINTAGSILGGLFISDTKCQPLKVFDVIRKMVGKEIFSLANVTAIQI